MATTSHHFSRLPPELRRSVWEFYLEDDRSGRHVIMNRIIRSIVPTKPLASPLLRVNREARLVFLKYFTLGLSVFKQKPRCIFTAKSAQGQILNTVCLNPPASGLRLEKRHAGFVYLRPATDVFVFGLEAHKGSATRSWEYRMLHQYHTIGIPRCLPVRIHHKLILGPFCPSLRRRRFAPQPVSNQDPQLQTKRYINVSIRSAW